jgi:hypothetical protein
MAGCRRPWSNKAPHLQVGTLGRWLDQGVLSQARLAFEGKPAYPAVEVVQALARIDTPGYSTSTNGSHPPPDGRARPTALRSLVTATAEEGSIDLDDLERLLATATTS